MNRLFSDLRYGLRQLRHAPGFTAVAIVTLALGIGASTAIFSAVEAVLLRALPYREPGRIVALWETNRNGHDIQVAGADFGDWRRRGAPAFAHMAAWYEEPFALAGGRGPQLVSTAAVGEGFFPIFGVNPELGRWFTADEHRPGAAGAALIGDGLWKREFGGSRAALGRTIELGGEGFTIVGVMPAAFDFPAGAEAWVNIEHWGAVTTGPLSARGAHNYYVEARLRPGVALKSARAAMTTVAARLARQYPDSNRYVGAAVVPLRVQLVGQLGPVLWILLTAVGFLLLIACANVANLLLARASRRQREMAIRGALGAGRGRIVGQLLVESILLAMLGGLAGCLLAWWGTDALGALAASLLPSFAHVAVDGGVLIFALAVSLATGILFGLAPALHAAKADRQGALQQGGERQAGSHSRLRSALIVGEVALGFVLLIGAGLMGRSLFGLLSTNLGFQPNRVWTADVTLPSRASDYAHPSAEVNFYSELLRRVRQLPGVRSAAVIDESPLSGENATDGSFSIAGRTPPELAVDLPDALYRVVSPGYFQTMGIPLLCGRDFSISDGPGTPWVAVVNAALARQYFPGPDPLQAALGQHVRFLGFTSNGRPQWTEIVGVVGDTRSLNVARRPEPTAFVDYAENPEGVIGDATLVARSAMAGAAVAAELRGAVHAVDATVPVMIGSMPARVAQSVAPPRFRALLLGLFAALALILAAVGLYGVLSYLAASRQREVDIRIALGAQRGQVVGLFVGEGLRLALWGVGIGAVAALLATRAIAGLLYGVSANDPVTFAAVAALLIAVALLAVYGPARRAASTDPMAALRQE